MEQKFDKFKKENPEELAECFSFIKDSVKDGSYFKDGLNWYFFRYVNPFCERTILVMATIVATIVSYCLIVMIQGAFPLVQKVPIIIRATDQSEYFHSLVPLKPSPKASGLAAKQYDPTITTVDEAVAKYLVSTYVNDREAYDYSKSEIEDINVKFNRLKNNSSPSEYREFQLFMSKDNPVSPIHNFGQNVAQSVVIESVRFTKKEPKDFTEKAKDFLISKLPSEAEVKFSAILRIINDVGEAKEEKTNYVAKISFSFSGVVKQQDKSKKSVPLNFVVNSYKLYKVQK
jgi:type IV secretory pathway component VirB8